MTNRMPVIAVGIFILFAGTIFVLAMMTDDTIDDNFDHYRTDVEIVVNDDGTAAVTETYNFRWSAESSGEMYVSFNDDKAKMVDTLSVKCWIDDIPASHMTYADGVSASHSGIGLPAYAYGLNPVSGDWEINAFYKRASSGEHKVTFGYTMNDAVVRYEDCVEFYYKVYTSFSDDLDNLTVTVTMPSGSEQSETYIFGHGDPNGYCEFIGDTADAVFKSSRLDAFTMFEIRVVTKQTSLYSITESSGRTFGSIMAEERKFYDDTQRAIMLANVQLILIAFMVCAGILIFIYRVKFRKRNKPSFKHPYTRDIPSVKPNISAHLADHYVLFGGNLGNRVAATVLNLAVMGIIAIEEGADKEVVFVPLRNDLPMTAFEREVHRMLFLGMRGTEKEKITLTEMKNAVRISSAGDLFTTDENEFESKGYIDEALSERGRFTDLLPVIACAPIIAVIGIAIFIDFTDYIAPAMFALFFNFILAVSAKIRTPRVLTSEGENERARTLALKRFYTDMTLINERRTMELTLWEKHLVYATALGVADKVIKELDIRLAQLSAGGYRDLTYLRVLHNTGGLSANIEAISRSSYAAFVRSSAGGGGGGGFSGGGGGGFSGGGG
ncbi:MAG: DUF2207 domain-containing protein, partial [Methanomassiliicoccaceae archaeon]|nr:DUF2207 domain-containing protein [Methanomassiliicoccaceae archaeon]